MDPRPAPAEAPAVPPAPPEPPEGAAPALPPLVDAAMKRSGVVWLEVPPGASPRLVWYVWHAGAAHVVHGGDEQQLPGLDEQPLAAVVAKSKDTGGRAVRWMAAVEHVIPGSALWDEVVPLLHAARLNPPDGEAQPARWATASRLTRLRPTGELLEAPGHMPDGSLAAPPPGNDAGTPVPRPRWFGRTRPRRTLG